MFKRSMPMKISYNMPQIMLWFHLLVTRHNMSHRPQCTVGDTTIPGRVQISKILPAGVSTRVVIQFFLQTTFFKMLLSKLLQGLCQWALGFGYHLSLFSGNTPHFEEPVPEKQTPPPTRTATTVCNPSLLWIAPS